jgi:hypothetical protein
MTNTPIMLKATTVCSSGFEITAANCDHAILTGEARVEVRVVIVGSSPRIGISNFSACSHQPSLSLARYVPTYCVGNL